MHPSPTAAAAAASLSAPATATAVVPLFTLFDCCEALQLPDDACALFDAARDGSGAENAGKLSFEQRVVVVVAEAPPSPRSPSGGRSCCSSVVPVVIDRIRNFAREAAEAETAARGRWLF